MSDVAISADNLSKSYRIAHQENGIRPDYKTLREELVEAPRRLWSRLSGNGQPSCETFWALKDVSFEIKQGEVVGIIGRNGAGKSTLLKILSRITEPTSGEAKVYGRVGALLEVGTGFHPELTGRENIFLNGAILGMTRPEIRARFDEIVAFSEIEKFLDTPVKRYSSGMYVRLAFAVAAHLEPEVLIVDEVLAVGDGPFQQKCLGKMEEAARGGRTVLFVSHNMQAVAKLAPHALYLVEGSVTFHGPTSAAINRYLADASDDRLIYRDETGDPERPHIRQIELRTSHDANVHVSGDPLEIELLVWTPRSIDGACISVQAFDAHQTNYLHVWIHDVTLPMCRERGTHRLICRIPKLRLYMGMYKLRIFFSQPPGGEFYQILDGVCPFEVIMPDTRRLFVWYPNECSYLEDCSWDAEQMSAE